MAALLSITGGGYSTGQTSQVSLDIAYQDMLEYLKNLGIKQTLTLKIIDTETDTAVALAQLKDLHAQGIRLVIGPYSSAEVAACKSYADAHDMMLVSPSSVAVSLAIPDDNVFRFVSTDVIQGEAMNTMMVEDNIKAIVPLVRNDVWGKDLMAALRKNFEASGGVVHAPVMYEPGTIDFNSHLSQLDANVADEIGKFSQNEVAVYMISLAEGSGFLTKAGVYTNLNNVYWYGNSGFAQNASAIADTGAARFAYTHGFPCPIYGLDEAAKDKWQPLVAQIAEKTGRVPDVYAITAYDAFRTGAMTLLKTGPDPSIAFLRSTLTTEADNYFGASGPTYLDINGDRATGNYDFWSVKHDQKGYYWKRTAMYNSATGVLVRL
jgi:branched-chain amino acid transport system substrate-binding protein